MTWGDKHGQRGTVSPATSFEPLGTEVLIVKVLGHLLEVLHVSAEREKNAPSWAPCMCHLHEENNESWTQKNPRTKTHLLPGKLYTKLMEFGDKAMEMST